MQETGQSTIPASGGIDAFIADVSRLAAQTSQTQSGAFRFILRMGEDYAYIRLTDIWHPLRFFKQMAGMPPVSYGTQGFNETILDDYNPARHYTAFVLVGFWLPTFLAIIMLWLWEVASFLRYKGHWSQKDIVSGKIGIRHGRLVRRYSPTILPSLIAADIAA